MATMYIVVLETSHSRRTSSVWLCPFGHNGWTNGNSFHSLNLAQRDFKEWKLSRFALDDRGFFSVTVQCCFEFGYTKFQSSRLNKHF